MAELDSRSNADAVVEPLDGVDENNSLLSLDPFPAHMLERVLHVHDLGDVQEARVRLNAHDVSLFHLGSKLPSLQELSLVQQSELPSIRCLGSVFPNVKRLHVSCSALQSLEGIHSLPKLRELHASHNRIDEVSPLAGCAEQLRVLDLSYNCINEADELAFLAMCPRLEKLVLTGNPVTSYDAYRDIVLQEMPHLLWLDGEKVYASPAPAEVAAASDEHDAEVHEPEIVEGDDEKIDRADLKTSHRSEGALPVEGVEKAGSSYKVKLGKPKLNEHVCVTTSIGSLKPMQEEESQEGNAATTSTDVIVGNLARALRHNRQKKSNTHGTMQSTSGVPTKEPTCYDS